MLLFKWPQIRYLLKINRSSSFFFRSPGGKLEGSVKSLLRLLSLQYSPNFSIGISNLVNTWRPANKLD